jgi:hypothetical protein
MKYKITDKQLESVIFLYLDNQDFIIKRMAGDNITYFVNSENDEFSGGLIQHYRSGGECVMSFELIDEIAEFFSMEFDSSKYVIARWVENTLGRRVKEIIIR